MAAPKRRLPAPLYKVQKAVRDRGKDPRQIAWEDYLIPGLDEEVLRNKLGTKDEPYGCTDRATLIEREERFTAFRMVELRKNPIPGNLDFAHMKAIHQHLFQDVYDWAGEPRNVDMVKAGHEYLSFGHVETMWSALDEALAKNSHFRGISDQAEFVDKLAAQWGMVNATHAFREGNTRSQVMFFSELAKQAGWHLDVARLDPEHPDSIRDEFVEARFFHQDNGFDHSALTAVLTKAITPIESLEQRLERAAAPSVDHERWAPKPPGPRPDSMREHLARVSQPAGPVRDEYEDPDKMRTAHRRIQTQENTMPIDPSRGIPSPKDRPGRMQPKPVKETIVGKPGPRPNRPGMMRVASSSGHVVEEPHVPHFDPSITPEADLPKGFFDVEGDDEYEDTRSIELQADLDADALEEHPPLDQPDPAKTERVWLDERLRKFPELRPTSFDPPAPSTARHRASDAGPEL